MPRPLSSLRNRIFLAGALVAVLSVAVAIQVVTRRVGAEAETDLQRGLERAARLVERNHASRLESLGAQARLLADLPTLKAAVATGDPPTVLPLARETKERVRADFLELADASGKTLARQGEADEPVAAEAVTRALAGHEIVTFRAARAGVLEVITVPITVGPAPREILGALSLGLVLDTALAHQFEEVTDSEVAFALDGRVRASTLPPPAGERLASLPLTPVAATIELDGNEYVARSQPLAAGSAGAPVAIILRSRTERMQLLRTFRTVLFGASLVGVLVAVGLSWAVARTVTRPLADLTSVMHEMTATGDMTRRIVEPGSWGDEDAAVLARSFNALTEAIHRFQREAALRERLSALGRLSTVIAHEVRNPLMIIKSSLATLRREGTTPSEAREVAADIEGEVARLGRLVDGVLDYARPLRLEYGPTDLAELCGEAASAVLSGPPRCPYSVSAAGADTVVTTDAERLRAVLVNVLSNARDASAASADGGEPQVTVAVEVGGGRARIVVADRGQGIPEADLPNLFEPYFTTKRTGTGLGLAIARNIVDALGGTIAVSSEEGKGTTVRIELPARPAAEAGTA